ncbi:MFS transporter [Massilia eurypsychrophila]|jgi:YNFM family putative membrane transporter|uniref:MFS transporter n=2 Tax=Massilia eurypsychrophila TaxID=1485217 RepID=A0A2G8TAF0_9BURK|nr:MFS transporter [Massilia eurypsychrophila]
MMLCMISSAITAGSPAYKRINRAMVFGGFSTFALLYCVQPLMPLLALQFALTPAQSSLVLSVSTAALALSLLVSSVLSDRIGRKPLMVAAMLGAAVCTLASAFAQDYLQLLVLRALLGAALGGMPAIAMAYLGEEIEAPSLGASMGLYIGGSAFGGMFGRVVAASLSDAYSWRVALAVIGAAGLYAAWEFRRSLPESRNFRAGQRRGVDALLGGVRAHAADAGLPWLFALAFLLMGCFVGLYNYIGYRLLGAPFGLSQTAVGLLSMLYLLGVVSSAWAGRLADRLGRRNVLWVFMALMGAGLLLTLASSLGVIVFGVGVFTFGFFAAHAIASSWVGMRARAPKALASALYLCFYYLGSSVIGWFCGVLWSRAGWPGVVGLLGATLCVACAIALRLRGLAPLTPARLVPAA